MKRTTAMTNFNNADDIEEIIIDNNIPVVGSLKFNDKKMQKYNGQYFYIFDWYDGKSLKDDDIKTINCEKIGKVLSDIHNIDLKKNILKMKY